jgi:CRISPR/Cas system endoribonuclease Cas6 (RAMP superfamily)
MADVTERDIDNIRYSFETQEFFQRQLEESVNSLINKNNVETDKVFAWFIG